MEDRVPELALSSSQTDDYFEYYYRSFIQRQMEIETETHMGVLDWAPKVQLKSRRRENMSKEVRTTRGSSTHWDSVPELMGAHQNQLDWDWMGMGSNWPFWMWLTIGAEWEANDNGTGICFYCMYWLFGILIYLDAKLPKPRWSGEVLGLPIGQGTLPSLRTGGRGGRMIRGAGRKWEEWRK